MSAEILIVDDEADIRGLIQGILEDEGYTTKQAANAQQAYVEIEKSVPSLIILDIWLQHSDHDGLEILSTVKKNYPFVPILMISGHGTIETAVSAIKQGAYDFIEKPFKSDRLLLMIDRALETAKLKKENKSLRDKTNGPSELIGSSSAVSNLRQMLKRVSVTNSRVLISGEPGSGKEVAARMLHRMSSRSEGPFVVLNCATMRPDRLEIELFGSEDGILGEPSHLGVLEQADGGTLLLDEVSDMPLRTQGKIVRVLQEQMFQRLGGREECVVDVRVIASTNQDLLSLIDGGEFREDLYYRLNVVPIQVPPLREWVEDIPQLTSYFMNHFANQSGMQHRKFTSSALLALKNYRWPGNVRQLRNAVERIMIMGSTTKEDRITVESLPTEFNPVPSQNVSDSKGVDLMGMPLRNSRESFEKEYLAYQIKRFGGNISKTAEFVGMERSALHRKLKILGISTQAKQNDFDSNDKSQNLKRA